MGCAIERSNRYNTRNIMNGMLSNHNCHITKSIEFWMAFWQKKIYIRFIKQNMVQTKTENKEDIIHMTVTNPVQKL